MPNRQSNRWSNLTSATKTRYKNQGISPATYNAYNRMSRTEKAKANDTAKAKDYDGYLQRKAVEARIRKVTGHKNTRNNRQQAARELVRRKDKKTLAKLFPKLMTHDHTVWDNFFSG